MTNIIQAKKMYVSILILYECKQTIRFNVISSSVDYFSFLQVEWKWKKAPMRMRNAQWRNAINLGVLVPDV